MIKYIIIFILTATSAIAGIGVGVLPQPGPGVVAVVSSGGETIGTSTAGSVSISADTTGRAYFWPVDGTLSSSGDLQHFTVTVRAQSGAREIRLALYTGDASAPSTYVTGSDTGWVSYTAAVDGTNITLSSTSNPTLSSGQQYWIGYRPYGYTKVYGTANVGIAGKQASLGYSESWANWASLSQLADIGQYLPGKWQITTE